MELTGKIVAIMEARGGTSVRTGNAWMVQEYVIEVPGQFPKHCAFSIFGEDRIKQFNIQNGEILTVQFDIEAKEFNGRWYNDVRAYNVIRSNAQQLATTNTNAADNPFPPIGEVTSNVGDDLPF